jgi:protocatechuate 3,4-dioxygenase beta subunit
MTDPHSHMLGWRRLLAAGLIVAALAGRASPAEAQGAMSCTPGAAVSATPAQTEGPYYKAGTPERTALLEPGMPGTPLTITGYVVSTDCQPIAGAWLDFWQADANGQYDNRGYILRGHQYTDADGRFELQTVVPGEYPSRTGHIHVKVQAPGARVVTTQLYFPGMSRNATDSIFNAALLLPIEGTPEGGQAATFTFVIPTA